MKTLYIIILFCFFCSSCVWKAFPDNKYLFDKNLRDLVDCYKVGDTMIFRSSTNLIDSFIISSIDSAINNKKGFFINARNSKSISVHYRQIPIDKWQRQWTEMGSNNDNKRDVSEDGTLVSITKFPDTESSNYYFDFKEFRCSKSEMPILNTDTITLDRLKITNYYKIDNCRYSDENSIQVCYLNPNKGLVAFKTKSEVWTRQN